MKYARIKKNTDIQRLFKKGKRAYSSSVTAVFMPCEEFKMAVIVSKKHGKAVQRNRIKRLLRQAFYNTAELLPFPCAVILIPKTEQIYSLASFENGLKVCFGKFGTCTQKLKKSLKD